LALGPAAAAAGVHPPSEPWSAAATAWTRCHRGLQPLRRRHAMALPQPACAAVAPQRLCAGGRRRRGRRAPLEGCCAKRRRWLGRVRREAIVAIEKRLTASFVNLSPSCICYACEGSMQGDVEMDAPSQYFDFFFLWANS